MPKQKPNRHTPMIEQFYTLKAQAPQALLFFRMGDFYELFGDDATLVAPILGIVLTAREKGDQAKIPFCGIPHHSYVHHLVKLLRLGYKVAIADQGDALTAGGLVKRRIVRTHTLACTDELSATSPGETHYLMAVYECPDTRQWLYILADYAIGSLRLGVVESLADIEGIFAVYQPKELVVRRFQQSLFKHLIHQIKLDDGLLSELPEGTALESEMSDDQQQLSSWAQAYAQLCGDIQPILRQANLRLSSTELNQLIVSAQVLLKAVLAYFGSLQASCQHLRKLTAPEQRQSMELSEVAIRDLELLRTQRSGKVKGSLWQVIHQCMTAMGSRELKARILHPWLDLGDIKRSHNLIQFILTWPEERLEVVRKSLRTTADLEQLTQRLVRGKLSPAQATMIKTTLGAIDQVADMLSALTESHQVSHSAGDEHSPVDNGQQPNSDIFTEMQQLTAAMRGAEPARCLLDEALIDGSEETNSTSRIFRMGYSHELDTYQDWVDQGDQKLREYEAELRQGLDIASVKVKPHKTYGYLIEITKAHQHKLAAHGADNALAAELVLKQTMVSSQRYTSPRLQEYTEKIGSAQEKSRRKERELYDELTSLLSKHYESMLSAAAAVARWDVSIALAWVARRYDFCQPVITPDEIFRLEDSFHPVVAQTLPAYKYTTNSVEMNADSRCLLITGPNMGGKSTLMRQVALIAVLNQIGSYVPAKHATMPLFDGVYTRVGASDHLAAGQSTFMVEMMETAAILQHATASSLVILDELGRGTSTDDGMALAWSFLKEFRSNLGSWVLFATHYHELAHHAEQLDGIKLMQTEVLRAQGQLHFSYRLIPGVCSHSFGLETARLAGIAEHILTDATHSLQTAGQQLGGENDKSLRGAEATPQTSPPPAKSAENYAWLGDAVAQVDPLHLTPLESLQLLMEWQRKLQLQQAVSTSNAEVVPPHGGSQFSDGLTVSTVPAGEI